MQKLSKVNCQYGAPMGRVEKHLEGNVGPVKFHLQTLQLDSGGYDEGGAYWGLRMPRPYTYAGGATVQRRMTLYWYWWIGNKANDRPPIIQGFLDAWDREDAKYQIRERYNEATFYN